VRPALVALGWFVVAWLAISFSVSAVLTFMHVLPPPFTWPVVTVVAGLVGLRSFRRGRREAAARED
jgi:hypothetical protein